MSAAARALRNDLVAAARRILRPTLIPAGFFEPAEFASLDDLAARLMTLAGDRPLRFVPGSVAYDLWDDGHAVTFHAAKVYAGDDFLAVVADRWETDAARAAAIAFLQAYR